MVWTTDPYWQRVRDGTSRYASNNVPVSLDEAYVYCRGLARRHYENFPVVTWMLPRPLHRHFYAIYAFCRWADDLGDELGDPARSLEALGWWKDQLDACLNGRADHPVFVALAETIRTCRLPGTPFYDLISAFEQDQRIREYETFDQLLDYCRRSANPVGRLVLYVCGVAEEHRLALSDRICTGLQLANFWQDVRRDWEKGRIYLPREDRDRFGVSTADWRAGRFDDRFVALMRFEVERARALFYDGWPLVLGLPMRLQITFELFIRGGLAILKQIERIGYRVLDERPVLRGRDFATMFVRAAGAACRRKMGLASPLHPGRDHSPSSANRT